MRNFFKWFGIIAFVVVIGVSLAACNDKLEGTTWVDAENGFTLKFNSPSSVTIDGERASYTISGNKVTIDFSLLGEDEIWTGKVSGNKLPLYSDDADDTYTFTKQ